MPQKKYRMTTREKVGLGIGITIALPFIAAQIFYDNILPRLTTFLPIPRKAKITILEDGEHSRIQWYGNRFYSDPPSNNLPKHQRDKKACNAILKKLIPLYKKINQPEQANKRTQQLQELETALAA